MHSQTRVKAALLKVADYASLKEDLRNELTENATNFAYREAGPLIGQDMRQRVGQEVTKIPWHALTGALIATVPGSALGATVAAIRAKKGQRLQSGFKGGLVGGALGALSGGTFGVGIGVGSTGRLAQEADALQRGERIKEANSYDSEALFNVGRSLQATAAGMRGNDFLDAAVAAAAPTVGGALLGGGIGAARAEKNKRLKGALKGALLGGLLTGVPSAIYGYGKNHGVAAGIAGAGQALREESER